MYHSTQHHAILYAGHICYSTYHSRSCSKGKVELPVW